MAIPINLLNIKELYKYSLNILMWLKRNPAMVHQHNSPKKDPHQQSKIKQVQQTTIQSVWF